MKVRSILVDDLETDFELNQDEKPEAAVKRILDPEADVIITAVMLGFIGTRYHLNQPCRFDYEHPTPEQFDAWKDYDRGKTQGEMPSSYGEFLKEIHQFEHVMSAMSFVLDKTNPALGAFLKDGQSREWQKGSLITGRAGGQMLNADDRHRDLKSEESRKLAKKIGDAGDPNTIDVDTLKGAIFITTGRELTLTKGSYIGMMDNPVNLGSDFFTSTQEGKFAEPTLRVIDKLDKRRWYSGLGIKELKKPWGHIGEYASDKSAKADGIDDLFSVGYIHGMISAIVKSVSSGPWCTPYELAAGTDTTKMASCFACTTYMYAAGFPPSSTHLGRGESWVPPRNGLLNGETSIETMPMHLHEKGGNVWIIDSLATRWHCDIYYYLCLGTLYLMNVIRAQENDDKKLEEAKVGKQVIGYIKKGYDDIVKQLYKKLKSYHPEEISRGGGNLFLDALTVHDSDWKRVKRTLEPIYSYYEKVKELEDDIAAGNILASSFGATSKQIDESVTKLTAKLEERLATTLNMETAIKLDGLKKDVNAELASSMKYQEAQINKVSETLKKEVEQVQEGLQKCVLTLQTIEAQMKKS